jgi:hypothetical protein
MNRCCAAAVFIAALMLAPSVHAADTAERERIVAERAAAETTLAQRERECSTRFVVTACVEEARSAYRATVASLRRQQAVLDDTERRQRAVERQQRLSAKEDAAVPPTPRAPRPARAARPSVQADEAASASAPTPAPAVKPDAIKSQEATRAAAHDARIEAAQAHRAAVERRNAEREKKGKNARPLPLPASAATP